jgi:hypothetical protein
MTFPRQRFAGLAAGLRHHSVALAAAAVAIAIFGIVSVSKAQVAATLRAEVRLAAQLARALTLATEDGTQPFAFDALRIEPAGQDDARHMLAGLVTEAVQGKGAARPARAEAAPFTVRIEVRDRASDRVARETALCDWEDAARERADCIVEADGGGFGLLVTGRGNTLRSARLVMVLGGSLLRQRVRVGLIQTKDGPGAAVELVVNPGIDSVELPVVLR